MKKKNWMNYIHHMEDILELKINNTNRLKLLYQLKQIEELSIILMSYPIEYDIEISGVFNA
ncbi:AtzG-like protein [Candidatus Tachikawaea gelatinosa]|uniref:DUF4089 domain-containing protein n=1 Tax=Candidatus Tachikawaea gelatinosa TaxID=1410383 RepID=A0A090ARE7_9ENTR|nr:AtzG-like protein [Candidatus Tachikawaea gelatinosa]BAP58340.1 hypothetical protein TGUWTKB_0810 [Candidatus Tachikawaea gelatinosa]